MNDESHIIEENNDKVIRNTSSGKRWYAVYTRPRAEKQVFRNFEESGIESFLPLQKTIRRWSDRKKLVEKPLLSSYIFVRTKPDSFRSIYKVHGVVRIVSFEGKPVWIPQYQIDNLRLLVNSDAEIEITKEKFEPGDFVEVTTGSLKGLKGEMVRTGSGKRLVVRIDRIEQNILVTIPRTFLMKINQEKKTSP